ncbi:MAG: class I SAM-dependent methyltransferase [Actinomycetota bacterium]|nr:class I SAM-dependent methyltransferase [Actinomycetota bacterium]
MSETAQTMTGSNATGNDLWGARARDWADVEDEGSRKLFEAVLEETRVSTGTEFLDVACGSGLACELAAGRGARVSGLDASPGLLEIARERVPEGDFRVGDMHALPWDEDRFDVVTFFNSIFFADRETALREAGRVARPGGEIAAVVWTSPEQVEATAYLAALEPLLPPLPSEVNPFARREELESLAHGADLEVRRVFDLDWTWEYPDLETLLRGWLSVGLSALAIQATSEKAVRDALASAAAPFRLSDGGYRLENICRCLVARA